MEYLEAKQVILIFFFFSFEKGLHDGHTVRNRFFKKIN